MKLSTVITFLSFGFVVLSDTSFALANGREAQALNAQFATLTASTTCTDGDMGCVDGAFAQCVDGEYVTTACQTDTSCFALPLVNDVGVAIACDTEADALARIADTGATGGLTGTS